MTKTIHVTIYDDSYQIVRDWLFDQNFEPYDSIGDVARKNNISWTVNNHGLSVFKIPTDLLTFIILQSKSNN